MVVGKGGTRFLDEDRIEGEDPLAPFGPNAAAHVQRTDGFPHCADLMINSALLAGVRRSRRLRGAGRLPRRHGRNAELPLRAPPERAGLARDEVVGAERVHRVFRGWLAELGHSGYASEVDSPGASTRAST